MSASTSVPYFTRHPFTYPSLNSQKEKRTLSSAEKTRLVGFSILIGFLTLGVGGVIYFFVKSHTLRKEHVQNQEWVRKAVDRTSKLNSSDFQVGNKKKRRVTICDPNETRSEGEKLHTHFVEVKKLLEEIDSLPKTTLKELKIIYNESSVFTKEQRQELKSMMKKISPVEPSSGIDLNKNIGCADKIVLKDLKYRLERKIK